MREHKYFVYIMCSNSGTLYIGITNSIYRRALQHKRGEVEGFAANTAAIVSYIANTAAIVSYITKASTMSEMQSIVKIN
jgi:predicted GIY-YIG superfamily endonuclease